MACEACSVSLSAPPLWEDSELGDARSAAILGREGRRLLFGPVGGSAGGERGGRLRGAGSCREEEEISAVGVEDIQTNVSVAHE